MNSIFASKRNMGVCIAALSVLNIGMVALIVTLWGMC